MATVFLVLIVPVVGIGEYRRFSGIKDLNFSFKEKEVQGSFSPDIAFTWLPGQNKIVMDLPIVIENPLDMDVVFSKIVFDVSIWGLGSGSGEISQRHVVPAGGSRTLWIRNFEVNAKDFENYVFTVAKGGNAGVDIDVSIITYYRFLNTEVEGGHATMKAVYPLERDVVRGIIEKKLEPFGIG